MIDYGTTQQMVNSVGKNNKVLYRDNSGALRIHNKNLYKMNGNNGFNP